MKDMSCRHKDLAAFTDDERRKDDRPSFNPTTWDERALCAPGLFCHANNPLKIDSPNCLTTPNRIFCQAVCCRNILLPPRRLKMPVLDSPLSRPWIEKKCLNLSMPVTCNQGGDLRLGGMLWILCCFSVYDPLLFTTRAISIKWIPEWPGLSSSQGP